MIEPHKDGDRWILVVGRKPRGGNLIGISTSYRSITIRLTFDSCWTGDGWESSTDAAQRFATYAAAEHYLSDNEAMLKSRLYHPAQ